MRSRPGESARDAEREEMLESAGGEYEPARFDLAAAHAAVAAV